jgi:general secretion pathway protein I
MLTSINFTRCHGRGFTLLEIMVALAILSTALAALLGSVSASLDNSAYLRDKTLAHWVAMNILTETRLAATKPRVGTREGMTPMGVHEWFWRLQIETTPDPDLQRLHIEVYPHRDAANALHILSAFSTQ